MGTGTVHVGAPGLEPVPSFELEASRRLRTVTGTPTGPSGDPWDRGPS